MINGKNISFSYDKNQVLSNINIEAAAGNIVGLIGPNGSGKSTFLRILYATLESQSGTVFIDEVAISKISSRDLPLHLSVVAQEDTPVLPISVVEMVLLGRSPHRSSLQSYSKEDYQIVTNVLQRVGIRHLAERNFSDLSGGEKQRALIARALAQEANHLLLDEPTNHLDIHYQHEILQLVQSLGVTTIIVLHDLNLAARYCDEVVLLNEGKVVSSGSTKDVLVPDIIEPVYRMSVNTYYDKDCFQLIFSPERQA
ncbi:ABC transporter ATP-binding protein [Alkalihalobacillus trypoxylicola]|uniref:Histidinol phosphatase n=1 Tax=Alkalihalobacillus trypoxylicola TaxID=519424 RepID=A0A161P831_9BACI|nr:ABC transporter ATP-binding protein [Alkalihalobacillus trypoxylicola]KYG28268.1 histidinol phosphatase [Alkalihalobacillus trypoxylicola]